MGDNYEVKMFISQFDNSKTQANVYIQFKIERVYTKQLIFKRNSN